MSVNSELKRAQELAKKKAASFVDRTIDAAKQKLVDYYQNSKEEDKKWYIKHGFSPAYADAVREREEEYMQKAVNFLGMGYTSQKAKIEAAEAIAREAEVVVGLKDELLEAYGKKAAEKFYKKTGIYINNFYPVDEMPEKLSAGIATELNRRAGIDVFENNELPKSKEEFKRQLEAAAIKIINKKTGLNLESFSEKDIKIKILNGLKETLSVGYNLPAREKNRARVAKYRETHQQIYVGYREI